jgi:uncharacterized protein
VSGWLLDVNVLLGCGWKSHADHRALIDWLLRTTDWSTCGITELGFVRISMTPGYQASFDNAPRSLATLRGLGGHRFLVDDVDAASLPVVTGYKEVSDAHLVTRASRYGHKLATLDAGLLTKPWANRIAENPLTTPPLSLGTTN